MYDYSMNLMSKLGVRSLRAFSLLFALSFVASAQAIEPSSPDAAVMEKLIKTLLNNLHQGNFEEASRLFRYPETYTKDELAVDQENVATSLRVAAEHLGQVRR